MKRERDVFIEHVAATARRKVVMWGADLTMEEKGQLIREIANNLLAVEDKKDWHRRKFETVDE